MSEFSRHTSADVIALGVRGYVRYRLSHADGVEWLAERGLLVNRSTVSRGVQRFLPLFVEAARRYRSPLGGSWSLVAPRCHSAAVSPRISRW
jgi:transposase-like protein